MGGVSDLPARENNLGKTGKKGRKAGRKEGRKEGKKEEKKKRGNEGRN